MAWSAPIIHAVGDILSATDWNIDSGDLSFLVGVNGANVQTSQTTTSTSYTDLASVGPQVTVTTGATAVICLTGNLFNSATGNATYMAVAVSGTTTIAAVDTNALQLYAENGALAGIQTGTSFLMTGLTAGANTFTAKYRVGAGTGTFGNRYIVVFPLP